MNKTLKFYSDGTIYEIADEQALRAFKTDGDLNQLRSLLKRTIAQQFTIASPDEPHPDILDFGTRGSKRINDEGLALVKTYEGLAEQVLQNGQLVAIRSYQDVVGVWTIGYGHTKTAAPGQQITPQAAEDLLFQDLEDFENAVSDVVKVEINDDQFSALVAFAFNLGAGALAQSTLLKKLNQGDYEGAANELPRWNKAGNQRLLGLTRRRLSERALFLSQPWRPGLTYDGPVDPEQVIKQLLQTSTGSNPPAASKPARTLKLTDPMMQGDDVIQLQAMLKSQGFGFNASGCFDEITQAVVQEFQRREKLEVSGVVDSATLKALGLS